MWQPRGNRQFAGGALCVALVVVLLGSIVGGAAGAVAAGGSDAGAPSDAGGSSDASAVASTEDAALAQEVDADRTRIRIALQPGGDGRWTVELWTRLADDADEEAFASLEADVRNDSESFTSDFRQRMNGSATAASDATGREMTIDNVSVSTRTEGVSSRYGVLTYEFEWTNFAAVDGERLRAGDAIEGYPLEEGTRMTISWPADYRLASVQPEPDDRTDNAVVWQGGETDFFADQPRVVVTSASAEDDSLLPIVAVVLAVLVVLFALAWLVHSGRLELPGMGDYRSTDADESAGTGAADAGAGAAAGAGSAGVGADDGATAGADGRATADTDDGAIPDDGVTGEGKADNTGDHVDDSDAVPPELLSNEEQVLRLLEDNGGRLKQQQVVAELEWTEAKTSQVVTSMREAEQIEVFRIGRENVLALPGEADL